MGPPAFRTVPPLDPVKGGGEAQDAEPLFDDQRAPLRLTVTRGTLGLELYEAVEIGPLEVLGLSLTLPNLRFPLDLSGGVPMFRNRRGELQQIRLALRAGNLALWLDRRLRELIGALVRPVSVWVLPHGLGVGLVSDARALAFDLVWAPDDGAARFVVSQARGVGLDAPALAYALQAVDTASSGLFRRQGRVIELRDAALRIGRALLPALGARAPSAANVRFGELVLEGDELRIDLDSSNPPPARGPVAARALELALLAAEADDLLARGELDAAREAYLLTLERAPRHPELTRLVAEIDVVAGGRADAALGMIVESLPATQAGAVGAELLARVGDLSGAREAIAEAARGEPYAPLAALWFTRLGELDTGSERLLALDRAVSRAPGLARPREQRFALRLERGDVDGALADAEHLEAMHSGARARHRICLDAARRLLEHGYVRDAGRLFERALRYLPDDALATSGLARAFLESGRKDRALSLFERAIALSERHGRPDADALIELAKILADEVRDLPQAIARVRQVSAASERAIEARYLEGTWRARLGDLTGASQAYGRMREAVELASSPAQNAKNWLFEAAVFERDAQSDPVAAERHLTVALRLDPHDARVAQLYREVAAKIAERIRLEREGRQLETKRS